MLSYNDIQPKKYILVDGEPYEVLAAQVVKKQRQKPTNQTKLRHLKTGSVTMRTFHPKDTVEEAEVSELPAVFQYERRGQWWFADAKDRGNRFALSEDTLGEQGAFLKSGAEVTAVIIEGETVGVRLPVKVDLAVTDAPPNVKGNTAQGGTKRATLETGATVSVPLFVAIGDAVRINTETGEYVERAREQNE